MHSYAHIRQLLLGSRHGEQEKQEVPKNPGTQMKSASVDGFDGCCWLCIGENTRYLL